MRKQQKMVPGLNKLGHEDVGAEDIRNIVDNDLLKLPKNMTEEQAKYYDEIFESVKQLNFANSGWVADEEE